MIFNYYEYYISNTSFTINVRKAKFLINIFKTIDDRSYINLKCT